jgi:hypothetical protein
MVRITLLEERLNELETSMEQLQEKKSCSRKQLQQEGALEVQEALEASSLE